MATSGCATTKLQRFLEDLFHNQVHFLKSIAIFSLDVVFFVELIVICKIHLGENQIL